MNHPNYKDMNMHTPEVLAQAPHEAKGLGVLAAIDAKPVKLFGFDPAELGIPAGTFYNDDISKAPALQTESQLSSAQAVRSGNAAHKVL